MPYADVCFGCTRGVRVLRLSPRGHSFPSEGAVILVKQSPGDVLFLQHLSHVGSAQFNNHSSSCLDGLVVVTHGDAWGITGLATLPVASGGYEKLSNIN